MAALSERHTLFADGASRNNPGEAGAGAALLDPDGRVIAEVMRYLGPKETNNVAEYTALIIGLEEALRREISELDVRMDSNLVVQQVLGKWKVKAAHLRPFVRRAQELLALFRAVDIRHVPREENHLADTLSNRAIDERVR